MRKNCIITEYNFQEAHLVNKTLNRFMLIFLRHIVIQLESTQSMHMPILQLLSLAWCPVVFLQWIILFCPPLSCLVKLENSTSDNSDNLLPLLSLLV